MNSNCLHQYNKAATGLYSLICHNYFKGTVTMTISVYEEDCTTVRLCNRSHITLLQPASLCIKQYDHLMN